VTRGQRLKRRINLLFWRLANPIMRGLGGVAPWWVVLETTGRRTGLPRRVPLARGPIDGSIAWLICVHGSHAGFARNIAANPRVRLKMSGSWREGTAELLPMDDAILARFNAYARLGPRTVGIDPRLVRIELSG
jgi:deazaflavin-dependent oxidoreductase (nitroreductase family)